MLTKGIILCFMVFQSTFADVFDVTTVYRIGEIFNGTKEAEIYLYSNARGLPFSINGKNIDNYTRDFPTFDSNANSNQSWQIENGKFNITNSSFFLDDSEQQVLRSNTKTQFTTLAPGIKLTFIEYSNEYNNIFIFSNENNGNYLRNTNFFYNIKIRYCPQCFLINGQLIISSCFPVNRQIIGELELFIDLDMTKFHFMCHREFDDSIEYEIQEIYFDFTNESLWKLKKNNYEWFEIKLEYTLSNEENLFYYYQMPGTEPFITIEKLYKVLTVNDNTKITSPYFIPHKTDDICLAVVANLCGGSDPFIDYLNITIENESNQKFPLETIFFDELLKKVVHITSALHESLKGKLVKVVIEASHCIQIQRISSCNSKGDLISLNLEKQRAAFIPTRITTSDKPIETIFNNEIKTNSEHICPPGFSDYNCETACGSNSFGMKCEGICSVYSYECKGLLLCVPQLGCQCAPGFFGETCEEECKVGSYGNDCNQVCGNCENNSSCDINTGYCETCAPGYYPPYCKDTYSVVLDPPKVRTPSYHEAIVTPLLENYKGKGSPNMFQIQYKESEEANNIWIQYTSHDIPKDTQLGLPHLGLKVFHDLPYDENPLKNDIPVVIKGLKSGIFYDVRVVLFDSNLNSYQGEDVPYTRFSSRCTVPKEMDYNLTWESNTTSFSLFWDYQLSNIVWCRVKHYQVSRWENLKWIHQNVSDNTFTLPNLLPETNMEVKVRAYTSNGFAPYSSIRNVITKRRAPGPVKALSSSYISNHILINWKAPENVGDEIVNYHLSYQCRNRRGCSLNCGSNGKEELVTSSTEKTLFSLLPFTQYIISVSAEGGPKTNIIVGTKMSVPEEIVSFSKKPSVSTNNSITVYWEPVEICSGFFNSYLYQLYKVGDKERIIFEGHTRDAEITINDLMAKTDYLLYVFIETKAGWNKEKYLAINISTTSTVPESVENLTVYKRGRNILGLRWGQPKKIYGTLKSFTIAYKYGKDKNIKSVDPTPCVAWPDMFCHTLENLSAHKKYTISVAARNTEVSADGTFASIIDITKEGTPGVPEDVKVINTTSVSFAITWKYPSFANGIIRSFLMNVEESEQFETEKCCQIYPLTETVVTEELENYSVEVSGLHPASTYTISLSAKTVSFGPSLTLTVNTRPPSLPIQHLPKVNVNTQQEWTWLPQQNLENLSNRDVFLPLIKANILLIVLNSTTPGFDTGFEDSLIEIDLKRYIKNDFYLAAECLVTENTTVTIGTGDSIQTKWATLRNPNLIKEQVYKFAAVQITEYSGIYNLDIVFSTSFIAA